jgi:hypothetical protein
MGFCAGLDKGGWMPFSRGIAFGCDFPTSPAIHAGSFRSGESSDSEVNPRNPQNIDCEAIYLLFSFCVLNSDSFFFLPSPPHTSYHIRIEFSFSEKIENGFSQTNTLVVWYRCGRSNSS